MAEVLPAFYDSEKTYDDNFDNGPFEVPGSEATYENSGEPQYTFLGKQIYSPFGIPAGPLLNSNYVKYAFEHGFDVVCYKTQRSDPFPVNEFPNVLYVEADGDLTLDKADEPLIGRRTTSELRENVSITNSFGNPSRGPEFWVPDMEQAVNYQGIGQLLIASVVGTIKDGFSPEDYYDDFAETAALAATTGADVIEVNLSCPNVANEGVLCYNLDAVVAICQKVKEAIGHRKLSAKFGYFAPSQQDLLREILWGINEYTDATSWINTIAAPIVNEYGQQALPGPNRLKSGVCGSCIKWAGLEMVGRVAEIREEEGLNFEIIGVGGVTTPRDVHQYRQARADLVQSATGAMFNPQLAAEVKASL